MLLSSIHLKRHLKSLIGFKNDRKEKRESAVELRRIMSDIYDASVHARTNLIQLSRLSTYVEVKVILAFPVFCRKLQFEPVKGIKRLQFLLLEYRFLIDSDQGSALPLSLPRLLFPLSLMLYIFETRAHAILKLPCYFAKLETKIVGLLAFQEGSMDLLVASLGVTKECRRIGIGTCILSHAEKTAKRKAKKWMEVGVYRKNIPAQRFYAKYGFRFIHSERALHIMRKEVCVNQ